MLGGLISLALIDISKIIVALMSSSTGMQSFRRVEKLNQTFPALHVQEKHCGWWHWLSMNHNQSLYCNYNSNYCTFGPGRKGKYPIFSPGRKYRSPGIWKMCLSCRNAITLMQDIQSVQLWNKFAFIAQKTCSRRPSSFWKTVSVVVVKLLD